MNNVDVIEPDAMPLETRLVALVLLLSSSSLHGVSAAKLQALRAHLGAAVRAPGLSASLRDALESALTAWHGIEFPPCNLGGTLQRQTLPARTLH